MHNQNELGMVQSCHYLNVCTSTFIKTICISFVKFGHNVVLMFLLTSLLVAYATSMKLVRHCNPLTRCDQALTKQLSRKSSRDAKLICKSSKCSTCSESGSWVCTINCFSLQALTSSIFVFVMQTAQSWPFQLATVPGWYIWSGTLFNPYNECVHLFVGICMSKLRQLSSEARYILEGC